MKAYLLLFTALLLSCNQQVEPDRIFPEGSLKVGFVIVNGVYNSELVAPMDIFHHTVFHTDPGMQVFTISEDAGTITTFEGLRIIPDYAFQNAPDIDILVIPSAEGSMSADLENERLLNFVSDRSERARFTMSLCDGAFVLAKAGIVDGLESTTFPGDIEGYRQMFPELTVHDDVSFVHHDNLITSAGGAKSYDPALYLVELLYGKVVADRIAKGLVIEWQKDSVSHVFVAP